MRGLVLNDIWHRFFSSLINFYFVRDWLRNNSPFNRHQGSPSLSNFFFDAENIYCLLSIFLAFWSSVFEIRILPGIKHFSHIFYSFGMFNDLVDIDMPFLSHFSIATLLDFLHCWRVWKAFMTLCKWTEYGDHNLEHLPFAGDETVTSNE